MEWFAIDEHIACANPRLPYVSMDDLLERIMRAQQRHDRLVEFSPQTSPGLGVIVAFLAGARARGEAEAKSHRSSMARGE
jgi:hypothetical protein